MPNCRVLIYDHNCQPLQIPQIDVFLFKGRSAYVICNGFTGKIRGQAAFGVDLQVSMDPPSPISVIVLDPQKIYTGNTYFNLHGGVATRLDLILFANPRSPGGEGYGGPSLNAPPDDKAGIQYTHRAIRAQPYWSSSEKQAVENLVSNFVTFVAPNLESPSTEFGRVAENWATALTALGIEPMRLLRAQQTRAKVERVAVATA